MCVKYNTPTMLQSYKRRNNLPQFERSNKMHPRLTEADMQKPWKKIVVSQYSMLREILLYLLALHLAIPHPVSAKSDRAKGTYSKILFDIGRRGSIRNMVYRST